MEFTASQVHYADFFDASLLDNLAMQNLYSTQLRGLSSSVLRNLASMKLEENQTRGLSTEQLDSLGSANYY